MARNFAVLLWRQKEPKERWAAILGQWARCDRARARQLLNSGGATDAELRGVEQATSVSSEEFLGDMLQGVDIFRENIAFLLDSLPHGKKQGLAASLGVDPTTVSRWGAGKLRPHRAYLHQLLQHFGLPSSTDLDADPLFLRPDPIGSAAIRAWICKRVESIEGSDLEALLPALKKLLE